MAESMGDQVVPEQVPVQPDAIPYCDIAALAERYNVPKTLSKRQTKKLVKRYRKEEFKKQWRKQKKERAKEKKTRQGKEGQSHQYSPPVKRVKKMSDACASDLKIVIDVGYEDLMTDHDIIMLTKQIQRCYSLNRRTERPVQLHLTSFGGRTKTRLEEAISGFRKWDVHVHTESYLEQFGAESVVFLTAESPNVLQTLDPSKAYIIGGLVDHNHHKGYCHRKAVEQGVSHARLPLQEFVKLNSRSVLAIPHVFEVLLEFVNNGGKWNSAITTAIPLRKIDSFPAPNVTVFEPHCEEEMTEEKGAAVDGEEVVDAEEDAPTEGRKKKAKKKKRTYKRFLFHPYNLGSSSEEEDSEEEEKEKARDSNKDDSEDDEGKDLFASLYD